jgi:hypothetical protein
MPTAPRPGGVAMATMGAFDKACMMIDCAIKKGVKKGR